MAKKSSTLSSSSPAESDIHLQGNGPSGHEIAREENLLPFHQYEEKEDSDEAGWSDPDDLDYNSTEERKRNGKGKSGRAAKAQKIKIPNAHRNPEEEDVNFEAKQAIEVAAKFDFDLRSVAKSRVSYKEKEEDDDEDVERWSKKEKVQKKKKTQRRNREVLERLEEVMVESVEEGVVERIEEGEVERAEEEEEVTGQVRPMQRSVPESRRQFPRDSKERVTRKKVKRESLVLPAPAPVPAPINGIITLPRRGHGVQYRFDQEVLEELLGIQKNIVRPKKVMFQSPESEL